MRGRKPLLLVASDGSKPRRVRLFLRDCSQRRRPNPIGSGESAKPPTGGTNASASSHPVPNNAELRRAQLKAPAKRVGVPVPGSLLTEDVVAFAEGVIALIAPEWQDCPREPFEPLRSTVPGTRTKDAPS